jgi:hypothetical protein
MIIMQYKIVFATIIVGISAFVFTGCSQDGKNYTKVEGAITYKGQPVEGATVTFQPLTEGEGATGATNSSGQFSLASPQQIIKGKVGMLPGEYRVLVSKVVAPPDAPGEAFARGDISREEYERLQSQQRSSQPVEFKNELPEKYNSASTTNLKATVVEGKTNTHDFELTD